jgi:hypothetical protein
MTEYLGPDVKPAWINAQGEHVVALPTPQQTLAEIEAQLASPDCSHRDVLERVAARLRRSLSP